jgi:hypothetical protein
MSAYAGRREEVERPVVALEEGTVGASAASAEDAGVAPPSVAVFGRAHPTPRRFTWNTAAHARRFT